MRSRLALRLMGAPVLLSCRAHLVRLEVLLTAFLSVEHCACRSTALFRCALPMFSVTFRLSRRFESWRVVSVLLTVMSGSPTAESLAHLDAWLVLSDAEDVLVRCWTRLSECPRSVGCGKCRVSIALRVCW